MTNTTVSRRNFLTVLAGVSASACAPVPAPAHGAAQCGTSSASPIPAPQLSDEQRLEAAVNELVAAMEAIHGQGVRIERDGSNFLNFTKPPRSAEFQGAGFYEYDNGENLRSPWKAATPKTAWVEPAPRFDSAREGRCFSLAVQHGGRTETIHVYEPHLRRMLIRKLPSLPAA